MDRKILALMVSLLVIAAVAVSVTMVSFSGFGKAGGFTSLFDSLEYTGTSAHGQRLALPDGWNAGDVKKVSDRIVDMSYWKETHGSTSVYWTTMWFTYLGNKWNDPTWGTLFYVPDNSHDGWLDVTHGLFSITVSSATNLSAQYDVGDVITLQTTLETNSNVVLAFGDWIVTGVV